MAATETACESHIPLMRPMHGTSWGPCQKSVCYHHSKLGSGRCPRGALGKGGLGDCPSQCASLGQSDPLSRSAGVWAVTAQCVEVTMEAL